MPDLCLPTTQFDTADSPAPMEMWLDRMSSTYDVSLPGESKTRFRAAFRGWSLGSVVFTAGEFTPVSFRRDAARIRRDQLDQIGLFTHGRGNRISYAGGEERLIRPGDLQFFDMAQEEVNHAEQGSSGSMMLPRALVESVIPDPARYHGVVMRDGAARVLANHILQVGENLATMPVAVASTVASASLELALRCLPACLSGDDLKHDDAFRVSVRRQVEQFIDQRLGDPALGASQIQAEMGLSRSSVYRLFEPTHGVARYIKLRRLARIRSILLENRDARTLAGLAADFGFQSSAHFSREFHRQYGCSPSELRSGRSSLARPADTDGSVNALFRSIQS